MKVGIVIAVGIAIGAAVGATMHNTAMGVAFGAAFGVAAGVLFKFSPSKNNSGKSNKPVIVVADAARITPGYPRLVRPRGSRPCSAVMPSKIDDAPTTLVPTTALECGYGRRRRCWLASNGGSSASAGDFVLSTYPAANSFSSRQRARS